jgi:glycosyltransferase involved in cell wall biosynthesis
LMQLGEWLAYKLSDGVISILSNGVKRAYEFGKSKKNCLYLPNCLDEDIKPVDFKNPIINKLRKEKSFILGYAGGMAPSNALDNLITAAQNLAEHNISLLLCGDGICKQELEKLSANATNIHFLGKIEKKYVHSFLAKCDVLVAPMKASKLYEYGIGLNKLVDYCNTNKPIILTLTVSEPLKDMVITCKNTVKSLSETILEVAANYPSHQAKSRDNSKLLRQHFSLSNIIEKFIKFAKELRNS